MKEEEWERMGGQQREKERKGRGGEENDRTGTKRGKLEDRVYRCEALCTCTKGAWAHLHTAE